MLLRKKETLRNQSFIEKVEGFISEGTGHRWNRLSSEELYAYYYEFNSTPVITGKTKLVKITMQDIIHNFTNREQYVLMVHEDLGLFYPAKNEEKCYLKINRQRFHIEDLLTSLNKRVTFFICESKQGSDPEDDELIIKEIRMYIPSETDSTLHVDEKTFNEFEFKRLIAKSKPSIIHHVLQGDSLMSNYDKDSEENSIPRFDKEFFVFTKMKIYGVTIIIQFNP